MTQRLTLSCALLLAALVVPAVALMPGDRVLPSTGTPAAAPCEGLPAWALQALARVAHGPLMLSGDDVAGRADGLWGDLGSAARIEALTSVLSDAAAGEGARVVAQQSTLPGSVRLTAWCHGLRVDGCEAIAMLDGDGRVLLLQGSLPASFATMNERRLSSTQALAAVLRAYAVTGGRRVPDSTQEVLWATSTGLYHAFRVQVASSLPLADIDAVVDADDGHLLRGDDVLDRITGHGSVYKVSPLEGDPSTLELANLDGNGTLAGAFAQAKNSKTSNAQAADNNFVYAPSDTHFDEAEVYYLVDLIHAWNKKHLGYSSLDKPMVANVHVGTDYDNAYFSPLAHNLNFGDGKQLNDLSKDASVVLHEYTHAVTTAMASTMFGGMSGALQEGYSDYFAATILNDPVVGRYAGERLPEHAIRDCDNTKKWPDDRTGEPHADGMMWSGSCWKLRQALGPEVADTLVHHSRSALGFWPSFTKAMRGVVAADQQIYGGAHKAAIEAAFGAHGITETRMDLRSFLRRQTQFNALFVNLLQ